MKRLTCLQFVVVALLGATNPQGVLAQTPLPKPAALPKIPPKLTMRWLDTLTVDPTMRTENHEKTYYATVKLLRPAISTMAVDLELVGGQPVPGNSLRVECVFVQRLVTVEPGENQENFRIRAGSLQPRVGAPPTMVQKTIAIAARYGSERVSTTFTVDCPQ